jgi:crotonobetainyl-CoA:carnitine CoA-transferase CaiB-like acyl-CoA transferase
MKLLDGARVIELAGPFGGGAARFLGSLGAEVIRVVAPGLGGAFLRRPADVLAAFEAHGKQTVTVDLDTLSGIGAFRSLLNSADFLIESAPPGALAARGLGHAHLAVVAPRLIHASITSFGSDGPYAPYRGSELIAQAMSGVLRQRGDCDRAPVKEALDPCIFHGAASAAAALLLAYHERSQSGRGQHVDISLQQVGVSRNVGNLLRWQFERRRPVRAGTAVWDRKLSVRCVWPLADGYLYHRLTTGAFGATEHAWAQWMEECGFEGLVSEVRWTNSDRGPVLLDKRARWEATLELFLRMRTTLDLATEAARRGIDATVIEDPGALLDDPQLAARGFFGPVGLDPRGTIQLPTRFLQVEANEPVVDAAANDVAEPTLVQGRGLQSGFHPVRFDEARMRTRRAALAGVKVLELSSQLSSSLTARALAEHGAQVIKLDSSALGTSGLDPRRAMSLRRSIDATAWYVHLNAGKLSVCVDRGMRTREVIEPLLAWADVVIESLPPDAPERRQRGYPSLAKVRPDLIVVSASPYGKTGPRADAWDGDDVRAARAGRLAMSGWPDRAPVAPGDVSFDDFLASPFLIGAIAAALVHRGRTGEGCHIDAALYEVGVQQLTEALVMAQYGEPLTRTGNRSPHVLHQGVYPTRGDDRYIAITLHDERDWARLTELVRGLPDALSVELADADELDAIDAQLSAFTRGFVDVQLMHILQARGIPAVVLQDAEDLLERDPQLRARGAFVNLEHPVLGAFAHHALPYRLDAAPAVMGTSPLLGQHTDYVLRKVLGLAEAQIRALTAGGGMLS